jgi:hypothetical protein
MLFPIFTPSSGTAMQHCEASIPEVSSKRSLNRGAPADFDKRVVERAVPAARVCLN